MRISMTNQQVRDLIYNAKSIALIVNPQKGMDAFCSLLSLFHVLANLEKKVAPIFPGQFSPPFNSLPGSENIKPDFGPKDLVISLDYEGSPIEKISYSNEDYTFHLVVHPKERTFDVNKIRYSYSGTRFDAILTLGIANPAELGDFYQKNQTEFSLSPIINLDLDEKNTNYGQLNIVDSNAQSLCELVFYLLANLRLKPNKEAIECLLLGLKEGLEKLQAQKIDVRHSQEYHESPSTRQHYNTRLLHLNEGGGGQISE